MSTNERAYHHGDLKDTLIRTSLKVISETGLNGFSVAKVAKQAGVSSGAPYRHFPDRESLLAATGIVFLKELTARIRAAIHAAGDDPIDRLASTAGAYVKYAIDHNVGFELFTAMRDAQYPEFHERSREMIGLLFSLVQETEPHASWSMIVKSMEAHLAMSQGFADMYNQGFFAQMKLTQEEVAERATAATRYLIKGRTMQ
ncbi:TetR/AcrR family transcriptional regulator [Paenibacillus thalictri]|uniref:TetR/AcrR family transcriptional regulator n=1 Tax=Paenibacillus thalictri TaxID=2527873 RepID=A0A4Q9DTV4_9BACL|nr:TetR/AcrR family transcriptional regulator [Paenibacillus thalictri]TBL80376.1 TetR/AcrR family transcriptional regulator [Paenibacillus thalictri]